MGIDRHRGQQAVFIKLRGKFLAVLDLILINPRGKATAIVGVFAHGAIITRDFLMTSAKRGMSWRGAKFLACVRVRNCYPADVMNRKYVWVAIGFVVLLGLLIWKHETPRSPASGDSAALPRSARTDADGENLERERTARRKASGRVLPEGSITTHQPEQLKDFVLTDCKGHQVSLRTALKLIDEAYQDACYFSLEKPLKLKYEIEGKSDKLLNFSLNGKTWLGAVKYVAALAGMEAKLEGEKVVLTPLEGADEVKEMISTINPELIEELKKSLSDLGEWDLTVASDPVKDLPELLRRNGIINQVAVSFDDQGRLTIHGNGNAQERAALEAFVAMVSTSSPQIKTITKLVTAKNPLETLKNTLSPTELQELMRQLSQQEGTELVTAPSIMSKSGQEALIEIKQENGNDWTGLELRYNTDYIGLKLASANQTELRPKEGGGENQQAEAQFLVYGGDSQVKVLGDDSRGYYYQITTLQRISSSGVPLDPSVMEQVKSYMKQVVNDSENIPTAAPPVAQAVPGQPGFVFSPFNNKIVDVTGIPSGTLIADPHFPSEQKKYFRAP